MAIESPRMSDAAPAPFRVLLDFDGTLVEPNVAIVLVGRFCPDGDRVAREVDEDLHSGRITLRQAWARQVALLPPDQMDEMIRFVVKEIPMRRGASDLLGLLHRWKVPTTIVSGGLDFYIHPILEREGIHLPVLSDTAERGPDGALRVLHPYGHPTCRLCGICKAEITRPGPDSGPRSVFIGDGSTDKFAAEVTDIIFARRRLREYCERVGLPHYAFEDFSPVTEQLGRWLGGHEPLPPRRRTGLPDSPCPISRELADGNGWSSHSPSS
jgi:2-hydroxy-3-keto-5-methylthiopentenyl-1-phosphate phosphatase